MIPDSNFSIYNISQKFNIIFFVPPYHNIFSIKQKMTPWLEWLTFLFRSKGFLLMFHNFYRLMHQKSCFLIFWVFLKKTSTLKTISSVYLTFKHVLSIFHWPSPKPHLTRLFSTHSFSLPFKEQPANCPCKNGGLCVQLPNYQMACSCRYGYTGQACENSKSLVEIDFCESIKKYF